MKRKKIEIDKQQRSVAFAILILAYIIVILFGFDYLLTHITASTGKASSGSGTVQLTILSNTSTEENVVNVSRGGRGGQEAGQQFPLSVHTLERSPLSVVLLTTTSPQPVTQQILLINTGTTTLYITVTSSFSFLQFSQTTLSIPPRGTTVLTLTALAEEAEIYTGTLIFHSSLFTYGLPVILTVLPPEMLFELSLDIPSSFTTLSPGDELFAHVTAEPFAGDVVQIIYFIKDMAGQIVYQEQEQVGVTQRLSLDKTIKLPATIAPGDYALVALVTYQGNRLSQAAHFRVARKAPLQQELPQQKKQPNIILLLFLLLLLITPLLLRRKKRH